MGVFRAKWISVFLIIVYGTVVFFGAFCRTCPLVETAGRDHKPGSSHSHHCNLPDILKKLPVGTASASSAKGSDKQVVILQLETVASLLETTAARVKISSIFAVNANFPPADTFPSGSQVLRGPPVA